MPTPGGSGGNTPGPPIFGFSRPLTNSIESRIDFAFQAVALEAPQQLVVADRPRAASCVYADDC